MADSTYRVGVLLNLSAGRFRRGAKAAAQDTDRLGGSLRKAAGSGSLMGRNVAKGTRGARREVQRTTKDANRLGGSLRKAAGSGSLMGRGIAEGARGARREVERTSQEAKRLGHGLRRAGRDGEQSMGRLTRRLRGVRREAGLAARAGGKVRGGIGLAAGVLGVAGGGFAIASGLKRVMTMEQRYARLQIQSSSTAETIARVRKEIEATASLPEIRLDASELLATVEAVVQRTGDLDFARDNLLSFAQATQGYGGPGSGGAIGQIGSELRKLGIKTQKEVAEFFNLLAAQGTQGAFTLGNVASEGPRLFSAYSRLGYKGPDAGREMGALAQLSQMGTGSAPEATTAFEALLRTFSDADKGDAMWREWGVNVRDASGAFRAPSEIIKEVFAATGGDPTELGRVFDETAIRALPSTAEMLAKYERILTMQAPPDALAQAAAVMAATSGAKVQEAKGDIDAWMQDKLTGPVGEVVTALTSFKDELLVGVGLLAGSWYAFKALRGAGRLLWRLAGRGGGPTTRPRSGGGRLEGGGPTGRPNNAWRAAVRQAAAARAREAARIDREAARGRSAVLTRTEAAGSGPTGRPNNAWRAAVRQAAAARAREAARIDREAARGRSAVLTRTEAAGSGPTGRPNNAWRAAVRQAAAARAREAARIDREAARGRSAVLTRTEAAGSGPTGRPNNAWRAAVRQAAAARAREAARIDREAARGRSAVLTRTEAAGSGPTGRPNNAWRAAVRQAAAARAREAARIDREAARGRSAVLTRTEAAGSGPTGRPNNAWRAAVRQAAAARAREAARIDREAARGRSAVLTRTEAAGSGPTGRPNNAWRAAVRQAAAARAREAARIDREAARGRSAVLTRTEAAGSGPTGRPNNAWRAAVRQAAAARAREAARIDREAARGRSAVLTRTEAAGSGPTGRPNNAPTRLLPKWPGGLWRALTHGLGTASAGAMMGLTAHDIATGAIPDDQVAPEVGGLAGGLGGSWAAGRAAGSLMRSLPGPIRFGGSLLAGLGGFMGGETAGRAATEAVFDPGWTSAESENAAQWILDLIPKHDPNASPEIGNWRGVGLRQAPPSVYRRFNRDRPRTVPEWEPPLPPEAEPTAPRRNRGRLDIGRNEATVHVGPITVHSSAADPREVAEEVADEIERRVRDRNLGLRDIIRANPSDEVEH